MEREVVEIDPRPASLGTVVRRFTLPGNIYLSERTRDVASLRGGEFLVWVEYFRSGGPAIVFLNTQSGLIQQFAPPGFYPRRVVGTDGINRLIVLGSVSGRNVLLAADLRSAGMRFLDVGPESQFQPITYAASTDVLFVAASRTFSVGGFREVDAFQASTGTLLKTLDLRPAAARPPLSAGAALLTNAAGTRLYVRDGAGRTLMFDTVTGIQVASNTLPLNSDSLDELRNRVLAHIVIPPGALPEARALRGIHAFSADSLQYLGRTQVPELPLPSPPPGDGSFFTEQIDVSGLSATIFVLQGVGYSDKYFGPRTCEGSQLIALDPETGQVRQTVRTTETLGSGACKADLVRLTEPSPPSAPAASVSGRQVTANWQASLGATLYEVEVGSASGVTNLTIRVSEPRLQVEKVPPGVYFVRVRAINTIGTSGASQELRVAVP